MARIPNDELERLKKETDLAELVRSSGVGLKQHGKDLLGLCPFHADTAPSLVVSPGKNLWNCLAACGEGGTVVDWVMKTQAVSFRHAVEILRGGGELTSPVEAKRSCSVQKLYPGRDRVAGFAFRVNSERVRRGAVGDIKPRRGLERLRRPLTERSGQTSGARLGVG
jgi:DNA primase